jgi:hypothetical protein
MLRTLLSIAGLLVLVVSGSGCDSTVSYSRDVFPILEKNCLSCHKPDSEGFAVSEFSVASYQDLMKGTKFGPVIEPGLGFASTLMILIQHKADPSINMPFGKDSLSERDIGLIKSWIDQGARDN